MERTDAGSSRGPRRIVFIFITVWLVLFHCSPPRLTATQLLRVLGQRMVWPEQVSHLLGARFSMAHARSPAGTGICSIGLFDCFI